MIRIIGVLLALAGLIIVGMSSNSRRAPANRRLPIGLAIMVVGIAIALLSTQIALQMGWEHP